MPPLVPNQPHLFLISFLLFKIRFSFFFLRFPPSIHTVFFAALFDPQASNLVHAERSVVGKAATEQLGAQKAADCAGDPLLVWIKNFIVDFALRGAL